MKKILLGVVLLIAITISVAVYYVFSHMDSLVKNAIETYGSQVTRTAVRVDRVHIEIKNGAGTINGLTIANPEGFSSPLAFSLGEIHTRIDITSLQHEPYIIDEIRIVAPQVYMEMNADRKTNLNELKNNLMASIPASKTKAGSAEQAERKAKEPLLIIRRVLFTDGNIQARLVPLNNKEYQLKLPRLNITDLGGKRGATATQITKEILTRLTDQARDEIRKKGIDQQLDKLKEQVRTKVDAEKAKLKAKSDTKLEEEKQKAVDKLKGMFNQ